MNSNLKRWTEMTSPCPWRVCFLRSLLFTRCKYEEQQHTSLSSFSLSWMTECCLLSFSQLTDCFLLCFVSDRKPRLQEASLWQLKAPPSFSHIPAIQDIKEEAESLSALYGVLCSELRWILFTYPLNTTWYLAYWSITNFNHVTH